MAGSFQLLDELGSPVVVQSLQPAEGSGADLEARQLVALPSQEKGRAEQVVYQRAKGLPAPPGFRFQAGRHIIIQGQRSSHILMLCQRHHDVNCLVEARMGHPGAIRSP